jgi:anti-sigma factor RsiW
VEPKADLTPHPTSTHPTHPSEDVLESYALGRLSESGAAGVETHLLTCTSCQETLTETDEYVAAMKAALGERKLTTPDEPSRRIGHRMSGGRRLRSP